MNGRKHPAQLRRSRHEVALKQRSQPLRHRCYPPVFVELSFRSLKVMIAPDEGLGGRPRGGGGMLRTTRKEVVGKLNTPKVSNHAPVLAGYITY